MTNNIGGRDQIPSPPGEKTRDATCMSNSASAMAALAKVLGVALCHVRRLAHVRGAIRELIEADAFTLVGRKPGRKH